MLPGDVFLPLPFADQARRYVQIGRKDGLAGIFPLAQCPNLLRRHLQNGREAKRVELAHGLLVHSAPGTR